MAESGLLAGFPVIDFKAELYDGAYHDVDSSVMAFEIAARAAFRQIKVEGKIKLLEPIMKVEVVTPDEYMGDVIGDLNSRRGMIEGTEMRVMLMLLTRWCLWQTCLVTLMTFRSKTRAERSLQ